MMDQRQSGGVVVVGMLLVASVLAPSFTQATEHQALFEERKQWLLGLNWGINFPPDGSNPKSNQPRALALLANQEDVDDARTYLTSIPRYLRYGDGSGEGADRLNGRTCEQFLQTRSDPPPDWNTFDILGLVRALYLFPDQFIDQEVTFSDGSSTSDAAKQIRNDVQALCDWNRATGTENHRLMFLTNGYLLAKRFDVTPGERINNDSPCPDSDPDCETFLGWHVEGTPARVDSATLIGILGDILIDEMAYRLQNGTGEFLSPNYLQHHIIPLVNLYDFARTDANSDGVIDLQDPLDDVGQFAEATLLYHLSHLALNVHDGNIIEPYSRSRGPQYTSGPQSNSITRPHTGSPGDPPSNGTVLLNWLYWGHGKFDSTNQTRFNVLGAAGAPLVYVATSNYRPWPTLERLANFRVDPSELFTVRSTVPQTFDGTNDPEPTPPTRGRMRAANKRNVYRTKDYAMGSRFSKHVVHGQYFGHSQFGVAWSSDHELDALQYAHRYWYGDAHDEDLSPKDWWRTMYSPLTQVGQYKNTAVIWTHIPQLDPWRDHFDPDVFPDQVFNSKNWWELRDMAPGMAAAELHRECQLRLPNVPGQDIEVVPYDGEPGKWYLYDTDDVYLAIYTETPSTTDDGAAFDPVSDWTQHWQTFDAEKEGACGDGVPSVLRGERCDSFNGATFQCREDCVELDYDSVFKIIDLEDTSDCVFYVEVRSKTDFSDFAEFRTNVVNRPVPDIDFSNRTLRTHYQRGFAPPDQSDLFEFEYNFASVTTNTASKIASTIPTVRFDNDAIMSETDFDNWPFLESPYVEVLVDGTDYSLVVDQGGEVLQVSWTAGDTDEPPMITPSELKYGDINGDGYAHPGDLAAFDELLSLSPNPWDSAFIRADVDASGSLDDDDDGNGLPDDREMIADHIAGLDVVFAGTPAPRGSCGDDIVQTADEQCDDGNNTDGDGCQGNCMDPICGDGIVDPNEECDDGNNSAEDDCNECVNTLCGDAIVNNGEQCDDGNSDNDDGCRNDCTIPICGDGRVDPGEECDLGDFNGSFTNGCDDDCLLPACGDGQIDPGEECDDGNNTDGDGCQSRCDDPFCGDGIVDPGEQCDDGNDANHDSCRNDCSRPPGGGSDGIGVELMFNGEGCPQPSCNQASGYSLDPVKEYSAVPLPQPVFSASTSVEVTDDAAIFGGCGLNTRGKWRYVTFDGLGGQIVHSNQGSICVVARQKNARIDTGYRVWRAENVSKSSWLDLLFNNSGADIQVKYRGANGVIRTLTATWPGTFEPTLLQVRYDSDDANEILELLLNGQSQGNTTGAKGPLDIIENLNLGNQVSSWSDFDYDLLIVSDDSDADCWDAVAGTCSSSGDRCIHDGQCGGGTCVGVRADYNALSAGGECGDGVVDAGEECDDGNTNNDDACRNNCQTPGCGDGVLDPGEECDDGNTVDGDGCQGDCVAPVCGDGIVDPGEGCDDGNTNNNDNCRNDCSSPFCGDGIVDAGEACDDGNTNNNDGCRNNCQIPGCGDGVIDPGEECDDGNTVDGDGCQGNCLDPVCGDGIVDPGESCDDGNAVDGDGCSSTCQSEGAVNLLVNGDFQSGSTGWTFYSNRNDVFSVPGGEARVSIETPAPGGNVQLYQAGITLQPGTTYRLTFKGHNTGGDNVRVKMIRHTSPYTSYNLNKTVNLTPTNQSFSYTFITPGGNLSPARLQLWIAPYGQAGNDYYFDDFVLEEQ